MTKHRHPAKPVENEAEIKQRLLAGLASGEPKPMTEADWEFFRKRALANSKIRESMAVPTRLKLRCIDRRPYLVESDGRLRVEPVEGVEMISLSPGAVYDGVEEDAEFYRVWDNSGEDYLYPKSMFALVLAD